jgi:hypothetical protein
LPPILPFPQATPIANFGADLRDGAALLAVLTNAWPRFAPRRAALRLRPASADDLRRNAELVVKCMQVAGCRSALAGRGSCLVVRGGAKRGSLPLPLQELSLPYELCASDITEPEGCSLLLLVLYLFQVGAASLASFLPIVPPALSSL